MLLRVRFPVVALRFNQDFGIEEGIWVGARDAEHADGEFGVLGRGREEVVWIVGIRGRRGGSRRRRSSSVILRNTKMSSYRHRMARCVSGKVPRRTWAIVRGIRTWIRIPLLTWTIIGTPSYRSHRLGILRWSQILPRIFSICDTSLWIWTRSRRRARIGRLVHDRVIRRGNEQGIRRGRRARGVGELTISRHWSLLSFYFDYSSATRWGC